MSEYPKMTAHPDHPTLAVGIVDPPKLEIFGTWNGLPIFGSSMDHAWEPQFPTLAARMAADPTQDWT